MKISMNGSSATMMHIRLSVDHGEVNISSATGTEWAVPMSSGTIATGKDRVARKRQIGTQLSTIGLTVGITQLTIAHTLTLMTHTTTATTTMTLVKIPSGTTATGTAIVMMAPITIHKTSKSSWTAMLPQLMLTLATTGHTRGMIAIGTALIAKILTGTIATGILIVATCLEIPLHGTISMTGFSATRTLMTRAALATQNIMTATGMMKDVRMHIGTTATGMAMHVTGLSNLRMIFLRTTSEATLKAIQLDTKME